ncbi:MAG TPA: hypothetical protein VMV71_03570 [Candidatus Paceibacterota bacterium]|nr:hypothetical protein [Candidatus Paceibacterota bacterium]
MEQNQSSTSGNESGFTAHVPPPPSEVTVRTMQSDLDSMAASGGTAPKAKPVKFLHKSDQEEGEKTSSARLNPIVKLFSSRAFLITSLSILLAAVFFAGYYVIFPLLNPAPPTPAKTAAVPAGSASASFEHVSFLTQATGGVFTLDIFSPIQGLYSDRSQVNSFLTGLSGFFFEIRPENDLGQPIAASDFLNLINANVLDKNFLNANFEKDFTMFLYKDKTDIWPGYIFKIKAGETPLLIGNDVSKIENASSSWSNLFLGTAGTPDASFHDDLSSGQPIRVINFSNPSSTLSYGWFFNKYLIISTSLDGMKQAVLHF